MNRTLVFCVIAISCSNSRDSETKAQEVSRTTEALIQRLADSGLEISGQQVNLTPIWMPDGIDADQQATISDKIAGRLQERFYRDTIAAPFESTIRSVKDGDQRVGHVVDFSFVVYGSLDRLMNNDDDQSALSAFSSESDLTIEEVTPELLSTAGIEGIELTDTPRLVHAKFTLLDKVTISAVVRTSVKHTDESITVAWELDERFCKTKEIANYWKFADSPEERTPNAYTGFAGYAKVTKLKAKGDALLVEYHYAFAEPKEWSERRISLRAKLSVVLQEGIRKSRRQIHRMSQR